MEVTSKLSLTPQEQEAIRNTWKIIAKDLKGNGIELFLLLFSISPETQHAFHSFAHVPLSDLPQNKKFRAHTYTFMAALDGFVSNLDDPELLIALWEKSGENHAKRGAHPGVVQSIKLGILRYFEQECYPNVFTLEALMAWTKFLTTMAATMDAGMIAAAKNKDKRQGKLARFMAVVEKFL